MKKITWLLSFLLLTILSAHAQSRREREVLDAVNRLHQAMIKADSATMAAMVLDELTYGHSGGHIDDKKEFVQKIVSGKSDFVSIDIDNVQMKFSGKTAVVRHHLFAKTNDGGKPGEVSLLVLLVWQKKAGHWKLLARQAVKKS